MRATLKALGTVLVSFVLAVIIGCVFVLAAEVAPPQAKELIFWLPLLLSLPWFFATMQHATRRLTRVWQVLINVAGTLLLEVAFVIVFPLWAYATLSAFGGRG
jgi:hypothetical protein